MHLLLLLLHSFLLPYNPNVFRITVDSCTSSSEDQMVVEQSSKKWDSVQQDVGYSSGENSIHEALNTCADHL